MTGPTDHAAAASPRRDPEPRKLPILTVGDRVVEAALDALHTVRERRLRDQRSIAEAFLAAGIDGLSADQAGEALRSFQRHAASIVSLMAPHAGRSYRTWNDLAVPAEESHYSDWIDRMVLGYAVRHEPEILAWIGTLGDPRAILAGLLEAAAADSPAGDGFAEGPATGITAYEAKLVLFHALPLPERRRLAPALELRFDLRDVTPAGATLPIDLQDRSLLTDGYFYGALRLNARRLLHGAGGALGMGIDCSSLVQETYEQAGFAAAAFKSPTSTASMIAGDLPGLREGAFVCEPLRSADRLRPGHAIVWRGHTQIYLGRGAAGELHVVEAVGRRFKTVREIRFRLEDAGDRVLHVFRAAGAQR